MESTAADTNTAAAAGLTACPQCGNKLPAGASYTEEQARHFARCGAILHERA